jgi:predicted dehydrogenase
MAIHHFDLLRLVHGGEAHEVFCRVWNPSWSGFDGPPAGAAIIEFDRGVVVSYRGSWISRGPTTPWAGEWRMELEGGEIAWTSRGDLGGDDADRVEIRPLGEAVREIKLPHVAHIDRAGALVEFAAAIEDGREPECSGRENLGSLALMEAAVESATVGRPVALHLE